MPSGVEADEGGIERDGGAVVVEFDSDGRGGDGVDEGVGGGVGSVGEGGRGG